MSTQTVSSGMRQTGPGFFYSTAVDGPWSCCNQWTTVRRPKRSAHDACGRGLMVLPSSRRAMGCRLPRPRLGLVCEVVECLKVTILIAESVWAVSFTTGLVRRAGHARGRRALRRMPAAARGRPAQVTILKRRTTTGKGRRRATPTQWYTPNTSGNAGFFSAFRLRTAVRTPAAHSLQRVAGVRDGVPRPRA